MAGLAQNLQQAIDSHVTSKVSEKLADVKEANSNIDSITTPKSSHDEVDVEMDSLAESIREEELQEGGYLDIDTANLSQAIEKMYEDGLYDQEGGYWEGPFTVKNNSY